MGKIHASAMLVFVLASIFAVAVAGERTYEVIYKPGDWLLYRYDYSAGPCYLRVKYIITEVDEGYAVFEPAEIKGSCPQHYYMSLFPTGYPREVIVNFNSEDDSRGFYPVVSPTIHGNFSTSYTGDTFSPYKIYWINYTYYKGVLIKRIEVPDPLGRTSDKPISHEFSVDLLNITLIDTSIPELRRVIGLGEKAVQPTTTQTKGGEGLTTTTTLTVATIIATFATIFATIAIYLYGKWKRKIV